MVYLERYGSSRILYWGMVYSICEVLVTIVTHSFTIRKTKRNYFIIFIATK